VAPSFDQIVRRSVDFAASAVGLILLLPVGAVIALLVKRESPGPVFFVQVRLGRNGAPFRLLKFRTMRASSAGAQVTAAGDPRVTELGRWLRASKLDELPQLVNVLRGDMSLVGPRPEVTRYARHWTAAQKQVILSVRPGITDPVTLSLRREEQLLAASQDPEGFYVRTLLPEKACRYVDYVRGRSIRSDASVLARTVVELVLPTRSVP
jgi:lipopolysaccharide/colanic/teichoic acid biosynthesis glycosyltransferase